MSTPDSPELARFAEQLCQRREALLRVVESGQSAAETVTLDQTRVGRLSRMDALQAQAMSKESDLRRREELGRIARALKRIERAEFGWCKTCEEAISSKRLAVDPTLEHCFECASREE